ncbi:pyruvate ferredoxin oxidoreductase, partial [bacterium]|nr:pyruvate ferredoxin oxidoreductase [bacterium]
YVAQTTPFHWKDLQAKVEKALAVEGPAFLNILMPCTVGWGFDPAMGMELCKQAVEANFWPLFEVEDGVYKMSKKPKDDRTPIVDWLKQQVRFKHLFKPGNEGLLEEIQRWVDDEFVKLQRLCEMG